MQIFPLFLASCFCLTLTLNLSFFFLNFFYLYLSTFFSIGLSLSPFFLFITPKLPQNRSVWGLNRFDFYSFTCYAMRNKTQWFFLERQRKRKRDNERKERETETKISREKVMKEETDRGIVQKKFTEKEREWV